MDQSQIVVENEKALMNFSASVEEEIESNVANQTVVVAGSGSTTTLDLSKARHFIINLGTNTTIAFTHVPVDGKVKITIDAVQDDQGSRTLTPPTGTLTPGGNGLSLTGTASTTDRIEMDNFNNGVWEARVTGADMAE